MSFFAHSRLFFCALIAAVSSTAAAAQTSNDTATFNVELNSAAETEDGSCRLTYVATNQSDIALDRAAFEVAVFDIEGIVSRLLVLEFGQLIEGKTKILRFDLSGTPCGAISRIVVNDVAACTPAGGGEDTPVCLSGLTASSRTAIQFGI